MQQKNYRAIGGAGLGVSDIQEASVDLLQTRERGVRPRLDCGQVWFRRAGLSVRRTAMTNCAAATVMAAAPMKRRRG